MKPLLKKLRIRVTADDIKHGKREKCLSCPVARAAGVRLGAVKNVASVDGYHLRIFSSPYAAKQARRTGDYEKALAVYLLPEQARNWITHFDSGEAVKPFTFAAILQ